MKAKLTILFEKRRIFGTSWGRYRWIPAPEPPKDLKKIQSHIWTLSFHLTPPLVSSRSLWQNGQPSDVGRRTSDVKTRWKDENINNTYLFCSKLRDRLKILTPKLLSSILANLSQPPPNVLLPSIFLIYKSTIVLTGLMTRSDELLLNKLALTDKNFMGKNWLLQYFWHSKIHVFTL